jgi:hypothetical protein
MSAVERIYDRIKAIFKISKDQKINTQLAAIEYAKKRMNSISEVHKNYIPRCPHHK